MRSQRIRCQSCGMPLGPDFFGTQYDGSQTQEYCKFCYIEGKFTNPSLTLKEMIQISVDHMKKELKLPEEQAKGIAVSTIPELKRWKKSF